MLLECGDRRFDLTHRMLVLGIVDPAADPERWVEIGVDGLVVRSSSDVAAVCDRVDVPVGVAVSRSTSGPDSIELSSELTVRSVGPLAERGPARIGRLVAAIEDDRRALLVDHPETVSADRRVTEVLSRLLAARSAIDEGSSG